VLDYEKAVDLRSSAAWPGSPAPIETEAGAMPADHGVGFHQDQDVRPAGPTPPEDGPEESVPGVQAWPRSFPFEHGDLLPEDEDFEGSITSTAKKDSDGHKEREEDMEHEFILLTRRNVWLLAEAAKSQIANFKRSWVSVYRQVFGSSASSFLSSVTASLIRRPVNRISSVRARMRCPPMVREFWLSTLGRSL
jgi:hypothetical protein